MKKAKRITIKDLKEATISRLYDLVKSNKYLSENDIKILEMLLKKD